MHLYLTKNTQFFFQSLKFLSCELAYILVCRLPDYLNKHAKIALYELSFSFLELRVT